MDRKKRSQELDGLVRTAINGGESHRSMLAFLWGEPWEQTAPHGWEERVREFHIRGFARSCHMGVEVKLLNRGHGNWQLWWETGVDNLESACKGRSVERMTLYTLTESVTEWRKNVILDAMTPFMPETWGQDTLYKLSEAFMNGRCAWGVAKNDACPAIIPHGLFTCSLHGLVLLARDMDLRIPEE